MRHKISHKKLNRTSEHRKALLKNMLNSLVKYEQITTTLPKAKFLRPEAEKLITIGKKDTLANTKRLASKLQNIQTVNKIRKTLSKRYETRKGGYTRIIKAGLDMVIIRQWQSLNLSIEMYKQKELIEKKLNQKLKIKKKHLQLQKQLNKL